MSKFIGKLLNSNTKPRKKSVSVNYGTVFEQDFQIPTTPDSLLGNGQFGVVKACTCVHTNKLYCVKEIERKMIYNSAQQEAENELMKRIQHPNIVRLVQIYNDPKFLKIVMERAFGGDMLDRILNDPQSHLDERLTRFYTWQVLSALGYLHDKGIAHRDLKPENVLLSTNDQLTQAKVCDFGYARMVGEQSFMQSIVGTPAYWAPEVRQGVYTMAVDLWSSGVLCYVALSGTFPFEEGQGHFDPKCLDYDRMYPDSITAWSQVSENAKDWITKCMLLNPESRLDVEKAMLHPWMQDIQLKQDLIALENHIGENFGSQMITR